MENERLLSGGDKISIAKTDNSEDDFIRSVCVAQDAKSIAARDKWWIEQVDRYEATINGAGCILMPLTTWQSLKQSLEVK
jgi:hypothetical protein